MRTNLPLRGVLLATLLWFGMTSSVSASSRGYLTTPAELQSIRTKAMAQQEPYVSNFTDFISRTEIPEYWPYGEISGDFQSNTNGECFIPGNGQADNFLDVNQGATLVYEKALLYHLTGDELQATFARDKILDLTATHSFGGETYSGNNQCILELGFAMPLWIQAADLLEDTPVWSTADKVQFQNWLATEVYKKVAWASRSRANNWGTTGSLSASMIADYLSDRQGTFTLSEVSPQPLTLTPAQAYQQHTQLQLDRMNGTFIGDAQCTIHGIQTYGGIPEELRRGSTGCQGQWLVSQDDSYNYTMTTAELLIFHAEFLLRRGDNRLFTNQTPSGAGSLKQALAFVLANPIDAAKSLAWQDQRRGNLFVAYRYYRDALLLTQAQSATSFKSGTSLPYGKLTHAFAATENPGLPPTSSATPPLFCSADIDQNGHINLMDYAILHLNFTQQPLSNPRADINADGRVNLIDYAVMIQQLQHSC